MAPLAGFWILCSLLFALMPNTRVGWRSALIGGIFAFVCIIIGALFILSIACDEKNLLFCQTLATAMFIIHASELTKKQV
jgi:hypothetical protein